jgi:transposase
MRQMSQVLRERAFGMLTAGVSTRAVARELNVHFSVWQYIQPASQPQTTCDHSTPGPSHLASSPADCLRPATWTADKTEVYFSL